MVQSGRVGQKYWMKAEKVTPEPTVYFVIFRKHKRCQRWLLLTNRIDSLHNRVRHEKNHGLNVYQTL